MLDQLVRNARRRLLFNEVLKQFAVSAALAIGALAALLTLGTRYLEWWVVALFAVAVAAWAVAKLRNRLPGEYAAAVWLDDKAGLHDALSTAHYFASSRAKGGVSQAHGPAAEAMLLAQREQAESMAGGVNVAEAVPFRIPRAVYGLAALIVVCSGLIGVRYFYGHQLNLSAPITEVIFQDLAAGKPMAAKSTRASSKPEGYDEARSLLSKLGLGDDLREKPDEQLDEALADALRSDTPAADPSSANQNQADSVDSPDTPPNGGNDNSQSSASDKDSKGADSPPGQNPANHNAQSDKSLLSKLKDAMNNMLGKPTEGSDKKGEGKPQSKPNSESEEGPKDGEVSQADNKSPAEGNPGGNAEKANIPGQTSNNKSEKSEGPAAAGADDGEKAIQAAAQLKAMGKISELIGKRSGQVTGESMIDVQSGDQELRTAYKDKSAAHGEGAGEVSRDQIPLSVQSYVQEYFQQVRQPADKAPAAKSSAPAR